jgi:hypothetical protein
MWQLTMEWDKVFSLVVELAADAAWAVDVVDVAADVVDVAAEAVDVAAEAVDVADFRQIERR